jgi:hypothetical protein
VDSFCTAHKIQRVYVAFELGVSLANLKKQAYHFNLSGSHINAGKNLREDIIKRFYPGEKAYTIPRYIIVNDKGVIVDDDAPRPSSGNDLIDDMRGKFSY